MQMEENATGCDGAEVYERRKKVPRTEKNGREERKEDQPTTTGRDGRWRKRRRRKTRGEGRGYER